MAEERAYLYCVTDADAAVPAGLTGLEDASVHTLDVMDCAAWFSALDAAPAVSIAAVERHNAVVQTALDVSDATVPVRFGQLLESSQALRRHLQERSGYSVERARVRGCVEFAIRILLDAADEEGEEPVAAPEPAAEMSGGTAAGAGERASGGERGSGTSYLQGRARELRGQRRRKERSSALAEALDQGLGGFVRERRVELAEQPPGAMVAHLVQRSRAEAYLREARRLGDDVAEGRVVVTGPWPPYSFVEDG